MNKTTVKPFTARVTHTQLVPFEGGMLRVCQHKGVDYVTMSSISLLVGKAGNTLGYHLTRNEGHWGLVRAMLTIEGAQGNIAGVRVDKKSMLIPVCKVQELMKMLLAKGSRHSLTMVIALANDAEAAVELALDRKIVNPVAFDVDLPEAVEAPAVAMVPAKKTLTVKESRVKNVLAMIMGIVLHTPGPKRPEVCMDLVRVAKEAAGAHDINELTEEQEVLAMMALANSTTK